MKKLKLFIGACFVFALFAAATPVQAGYPLAVWSGSTDAGGSVVVLMDFDASVFTLADVAEFKAMMLAASGGTGDMTDFFYVFGPQDLGGDGAFWNSWLLANYQTALGADAYVHLQLSQSANAYGTNYDVMVFLSLGATEPPMSDLFVLGLQVPVFLADSLFDLISQMLAGGGL